MFGSLQRGLGTLDRINGWVRVLGMVNSAPDSDQQPPVINGFLELILDVFGPEVGRHTRSAVGVAALPFGNPVEVGTEVSIQTINQWIEDHHLVLRKTVQRCRSDWFSIAG